MRPARLILLVAVLACSAVLDSGCWDRKDPENSVWVSAIGVDKGPRQDYLFTFQMVVPRAVAGQGGQGSGGSGGGGPEQNFVVYSVEAADVISALNLTDAFVARDVSIQHAKAVIIGDEIAREGVAPVLGAAIRYIHFRRSMFMMVSRGTAKQFLELAKPRLEANPTFWFELIIQWAQDANLVPSARVHTFVLEMESGVSGARATQVAPRPDIKRGEAREEIQERGGTTPPNAVDTYAGEAHRVGEVPVDIMGTAVFRGDRLVGYLTGNETRLLSILRNELNQPRWSFVDPYDPDARVLIIMRQASAPKLQVRLQGGQIYASWTMELEGDLASTQTRIDYAIPEHQRRLELAVARNLEKEMTALLEKALHDWHVDIFRLQNRVRTRFATLQQWEQFGWNRRLEQTKFDVHVSFRVRRHGLQTEPAAPRR